LRLDRNCESVSIIRVFPRGHHTQDEFPGKTPGNGPGKCRLEGRLEG